MVAADQVVGPTAEYFVQYYVTVTGDSDISAPFYAKCGINFNDSFDVKVIDAKMRPVEGAWLTVRYQYSKTFGNKYTLTNPGQTNSNGIRHYTIQNQEPNVDNLDCKIVVYGLMDQSINATTIVARSHSDPVIVYLPDIYAVTMIALDGNGKPMQGVIISVDDNASKTTDSAGTAKFWLSSRNASYIASYLKAKVTGNLDIVNDTMYILLFKSYSVTIYLVDDTGKPLNGTLTFMGKKSQLGSDGMFYYNESWGNTIQYTAEYKGVVKTGTMQLDNKNTETVAFDINPPTITSVEQQVVNDIPRLAITIVDSGLYASKVDPSSIVVRYNTGGNAVSDWSNARVYTYGKDTWIAEFPQLQPNTIVSFRIEAKDYSGNKATIDGKFVSKDSGTPNPNVTINNNTNSNDGNTQKNEAGIPILYIAGGIIAAFIIIFLVFRIKTGSGGDG
jgi:hypothetical protein